MSDTRARLQDAGRKGGKRTSEAKAAAARENGRKGGRPKNRAGKSDQPAWEAK